MKPSIPRGTRDFSPSVMAGRNFILDTIRRIYLKYGYSQIETPAMENLTTLTGKYGDEGDQLLFKILNSRVHESKKKEELLKEFQQALDHNLNSELLTERALRYDLTVPFARYVVMHQNEIVFPFKRFQVQPVWRADRPQKGRYREFYQCDADVIGSNSLLNEAEIILMMEEVFRSLNIPVIIKMNNRKVLSGLAEVIGQPDKLIEITVAIDKLEKIGKEKVVEELAAQGITGRSLELLLPLLEFNDTSFTGKISFLKEMLKSSETGLIGIAELEKVFQLVNIPSLELDITLARGLNYYTGAIFEVKARDVEIGSITGGGRYDDLTGVFGLPGLSGVGISFGIDRIYDVMEASGLLNDSQLRDASVSVMFVNFGEQEAAYSFKLLQEVRAAGIASLLYPDAAKIKKQFSWADSYHIPLVVIAGADEIQSGVLNIKNMRTGAQLQCPVNELTIQLQKQIASLE